MEVNFIITAHDKEGYLPWLRRVLASYDVIKPNVAVCYNGDDPSFPFDVACADWPQRADERAHSEGDLGLTLSGYRWHRLKNRQCTRFIKMGIDFLLCDESQIVRIFNELESARCGYGGNPWDQPLNLATDIIFADTRFGNVFEDFQMDARGSFESWMCQHCARKKIRTFHILDRYPVHPDNRTECAALKWTMHHELKGNLANLRKWRPDLAVDAQPLVA